MDCEIIKVTWEPTKDEFRAIGKIVFGEKPRIAMNQCGLQQYNSRHLRYRSLIYLAGFYLNLNLFFFPLIRIDTTGKIKKKREKLLQEKRNWAHIIKKQESIQKLKRKCNDAETETREAQNALQALKAERDRAVERFVIIRD